MTTEPNVRCVQWCPHNSEETSTSIDEENPLMYGISNTNVERYFPVYRWLSGHVNLKMRLGNAGARGESTKPPHFFVTSTIYHFRSSSDIRLMASMATAMYIVQNEGYAYRWFWGLRWKLRQEREDEALPVRNIRGLRDLGKWIDCSSFVLNHIQDEDGKKIVPGISWFYERARGLYLVVLKPIVGKNHCVLVWCDEKLIFDPCEPRPLRLFNRALVACLGDNRKLCTADEARLVTMLRGPEASSSRGRNTSRRFDFLGNPVESADGEGRNKMSPLTL